MTDVSVVRPGEGEVIELGPVMEMRILEDGSNTRHRLGIAVGTLAPHVAGPPQHRHAEHEEGFYVISGNVRFTVGEQVHDAGPGTLIMVPIGAPHTFANVSDEPAVMLTTFTPDHYLQYFRDLSAASSDGPPAAGEITAIMARYATEASTEFSS